MGDVNNSAVPGLKKAENFGAAFQSVSSTSVVVRFGRLHSSGLFGWCYRMRTLLFAAAAIRRRRTSRHDIASRAQSCDDQCAAA